jgi:hypothetical protein
VIVAYTVIFSIVFLVFDDLVLMSSSQCDDFFVVHIPSEYDNVFECVFKTEFTLILSEVFQRCLRRVSSFIDLLLKQLLML